jgi:hypothetical protein
MRARTWDELKRDVAGEMRRSAEAVRRVLEERRRCTARRLDGRPCRAWAVWDAEGQLCAAHLYRERGPELTPEERERRRRKRTRPVCDCPAYQWPHRPRAGLCRWPDPPREACLTSPGSRRSGKLPRSRSDRILARILTSAKGGED